MRTMACSAPRARVPAPVAAPGRSIAPRGRRQPFGCRVGRWRATSSRGRLSRAAGPSRKSRRLPTPRPICWTLRLPLRAAYSLYRECRWSGAGCAGLCLCADSGADDCACAMSAGAVTAPHRAQVRYGQRRGAHCPAVQTKGGAASLPRVPGRSTAVSVGAVGAAFSDSAFTSARADNAACAARSLLRAFGALRDLEALHCRPSCKNDSERKPALGEGHMRILGCAPRLSHSAAGWDSGLRARGSTRPRQTLSSLLRQPESP